MLPIYISRYSMRQSNGILFQWLNVNARWFSSSDSSSDSDSDSEKVKQKRTYMKETQSTTSDNKDKLGNVLYNIIKQASSKTDSPTKMEQRNTETTEIKTENIDLTSFINKVIEAKKIEKTIDVAIPPKKVKSVEKPIPYEKKLINAAEDVATTLGGDKEKTTTELLERVLPPKIESLGDDKAFTKNIKSDKSSMQFTTSESIPKWNQKPEFRQSSEYKDQTNFMKNRYSEKKSVIHSLLNEYKKQSSVQSTSSKKLQRLPHRAEQFTRQNYSDTKKFDDRLDLNLWNGSPTPIFEQTNENVASPDIPELKTWSALEKADLKALTIYPPANIFQEMMLWTEQGKLWKFPIDNEQGMEEEQNVHFSEHVFMERHLKGWCPNIGPIRHFMELVCNGLSKNPYLTVQEKIDHIMWYKDYFKGKESLLQEVGAIKEPFPDEMKQITE